ncbi:MAG TPA: hypothetical protein VKD71_07370 [Gemmataceae bacterium]|nr:hypothetical protein [Gemmataceae bacterium]
MSVRGSVGLVAEIALAVGALAASIVILAPKPQTGGEDLVQDYLSARALLAGEDPYQPLQPLRGRMGLPASTQFEMKSEYNPHPPIAVLLSVPIAWLPFDEAYRVHCVIQVVLLGVAWVFCCRLAGIRSPALSVAGGTLLGLWPPVWGGLDWGQPVGVLAILAVALWTLVPAEPDAPSEGDAASVKAASPSLGALGSAETAFGLLLVIGCLVRPLFAGFAATAGRWTVPRLTAVAVPAVGIFLGSFLIVGVTPWDWYVQATQVRGFTAAGSSIPAVLHLSAAVGVVGFVLWVTFTAFLASRGLPAREATAVGLIGGLLWYPLAWFHYEVVLLPIGIWAAGEAGRRRHWFTLLAVAAYVALRFIPPYARIAGSMTWLPVVGRLCLLAACGMLAFTEAARRRRERTLAIASLPQSPPSPTQSVARVARS